MKNLKKAKLLIELLSTRISVIISILWIAYIALESSELMNTHGMYGEEILSSLLIGLAVIWLLKLAIGSMVKNKEK